MIHQVVATRWFELIASAVVVVVGLSIGFNLNQEPEHEPEVVYVPLQDTRPKIVVRAKPQPAPSSHDDEPLPPPKTDRERAKRIYDRLRGSTTPAVDLRSALSPLDDRTLDVVWSILWTMGVEDHNSHLLELLADRTYRDTLGFETLKAIEHTLQEPSIHSLRAIEIAERYDVFRDEIVMLLGHPLTHSRAIRSIKKWPDRKSHLEAFLKRTPKSNKYYFRVAEFYQNWGGKKNYAKGLSAPTKLVPCGRVRADMESAPIDIW